MFRPQIQRTRVLVGLAMLNIIMVYCASNSYEQNLTYGFELKNQANFHDSNFATNFGHC